MAERFKLPPQITASKWDTVWDALWSAGKQARGTGKDAEGTAAPRMTNREALALVAGLRALAPMVQAGWVNWYQFAALAYGWSPKSDKLDTSKARADKLYPIDGQVQLMLEAQRILLSLEAEHPEVPAKLELTAGDFDDPLVQGDVSAALQGDGAKAQVVPIPTGSCKERSTGKVRKMRPPCDKDGKGPLEPISGKRLPCDKPGECEPETVDVDLLRPIKQLAVVALIVGGLYFWGKRRGRRSRGR